MLYGMSRGDVGGVTNIPVESVPTFYFFFFVNVFYYSLDQKTDYNFGLFIVYLAPILTSYVTKSTNFTFD